MNSEYHESLASKWSRIRFILLAVGTTALVITKIIDLTLYRGDHNLMQTTLGMLLAFIVFPCFLLVLITTFIIKYHQDSINEGKSTQQPPAGDSLKAAPEE